MKKLLIAIMLFMLAATVFAGRPIGKREIVRVTYGVSSNNDVSTVDTTSAIPIFEIAEKTVINDVIVYTATACVGGNIIVGDGSDDNGLVTAGAEDVEGASLYKGTTDAYRGAYIAATATESMTKYYATADTVDITLSATPLTACEQTYYFDITRLD